MKPNNHSILYTKFVNEQCTKSELHFLYTYFNTSDEKELRTLIQEQINQFDSEDNKANVEEEKVLQQVFKEIKEITQPEKVKTTEVRKIKWRSFISIAAAVAIIGLSFSLYIYLSTIQGNSDNSFLLNNVAPGGDKATLTLANGQTILLDSLKNGVLTQEDGIKINKSDDGQITYEILNTELLLKKEPTYHTVTTPSGGQFKIILPDGTKVWLNAASSLKFPTRFSGNDRRVVLKGEGYFEVVSGRGERIAGHEPLDKPFIVESKNQEVEVLGTHFNIQAYEDDAEIKTALLEGSVKVKNKHSEKEITLKPGQQAILNDNIFHAIPIKMDEAVAWKNGNFVFSNEELESIMKKIERWYDVQVSYEAPKSIKNQKFSGTISRFSHAKDVLDMLELTDAVHFKIEERRVIVMK